MKSYDIEWEVIAVDDGGEFVGIRRVEAGGFTTKEGEMADLRKQLIAALSQRFPKHQVRSTYDTYRTYEITITERV